MSDKLRRWQQAVAQADRLDREMDVLGVMRESPFDDETAVEHVQLMVQQSKRVRREANMLVRALAALRDTYSQEAQGNE